MFPLEGALVRTAASFESAAEGVTGVLAVSECNNGVVVGQLEPLPPGHVAVAVLSIVYLQVAVGAVGTRLDVESRTGDDDLGVWWRQDVVGDDLRIVGEYPLRGVLFNGGGILGEQVQCVCTFGLRLPVEEAREMSLTNAALLLIRQAVRGLLFHVPVGVGKVTRPRVAAQPVVVVKPMQPLLGAVGVQSKVVAPQVVDHVRHAHDFVPDGHVHLCLHFISER